MLSFLRSTRSVWRLPTSLCWGRCFTASWSRWCTLSRASVGNFEPLAVYSGTPPTWRPGLPGSTGTTWASPWQGTPSLEEEGACQAKINQFAFCISQNIITSDQETLSLFLIQQILVSDLWCWDWHPSIRHLLFHQINIWINTYFHTDTINHMSKIIIKMLNHPLYNVTCNKNNPLFCWWRRLRVELSLGSAHPILRPTLPQHFTVTTKVNRVQPGWHWHQQWTK